MTIPFRDRGHPTGNARKKSSQAVYTHTDLIGIVAHELNALGIVAHGVCHLAKGGGGEQYMSATDTAHHAAIR